MTTSGASIELQPRDIALLRELFVSRIMTLAHAAALHFDGRSEAAKKRVQKLKAAGYVTERPRKSRDPGILTLAAKGFKELTAGGHIGDLPRLSAEAFSRRARVSDLTIRHELAVMDVKAALVPAVRSTVNMRVVEFTTWPLLNEFAVDVPRRSRVTVKPDGYLRIEEEAADGAVFEHAFFLEVDRGSETLSTLADRALCYRHHYASGGYAKSHGGSADAFASFPFRVLYVLPTEARLLNTAAALLALQPPIETQVWLAVMQDVATNPLGPIWVRPRDCRAGASAVERRALLSE